MGVSKYLTGTGDDLKFIKVTVPNLPLPRTQTFFTSFSNEGSIFKISVDFNFNFNSWRFLLPKSWVDRHHWRERILRTAHCCCSSSWPISWAWASSSREWEEPACARTKAACFFSWQVLLSYVFSPSLLKCRNADAMESFSASSQSLSRQGSHVSVYKRVVTAHARTQARTHTHTQRDTHIYVYTFARIPK